MPSTDSEVRAIVSNIYKYVERSLVSFSYEKCPYRVSRENLEDMGDGLRTYIKTINQHSEFKKYLDTVQYALRKAFDQVGLARETFSSPSLARRKAFYKTHESIRQALVEIKTQLDDPRAAFHKFVPAPSLSRSQVSKARTEQELALLLDRLTELTRIFLEEDYRSFTENNLLSFEGELRGILEAFEIAQNIRQAFSPAQKTWNSLRETVLLMNFAVDALDFSQYKPFQNACADVRDALERTEDHFRLRK